MKRDRFEESSARPAYFTGHYLCNKTNSGAKIKDNRRFNYEIFSAVEAKKYLNKYEFSFITRRQFFQNCQEGCPSLSCNKFYRIPTSGDDSNNIIDLRNESLSFRKLTEMMKDIEENISLKKNDRVNAELACVVNSLPREFIIAFINHLPTVAVKNALHYLNPTNYVSNSQMRIELRDTARANNKDSRKKNDGRFQLFFVKGDESYHLHFQHKNALIVYIIYLIDRYENGTEVDTIDILDYELEYKKLYNLMYPNDQFCDRSYNTIASKFSEGGKKRKPRLYDCYYEIRSVVGRACAKLNEMAALYVIADASSHIYVSRECILVPSELLNIIKIK